MSYFKILGDFLKDVYCLQCRRSWELPVCKFVFFVYCFSTYCKTLSLIRKRFYSYNYHSRIRITKGNLLSIEKKDEINKIIETHCITPDLSPSATLDRFLAAKMLAGFDIHEAVIDCLFFLLLQFFILLIVNFCWMVNGIFIIHCVVHQLELHNNVVTSCCNVGLPCCCCRSSACLAKQSCAP